MVLEVKQLARKYALDFKMRTGLRIKHSEALDIISKLSGFKDWNIFLAMIKRDEADAALRFTMALDKVNDEQRKLKKYEKALR